MYKWKVDASGTIVNAKPRLVAKGFGHIEGVDYFETLSSAPSASSIWILAALARKLD